MSIRATLLLLPIPLLPLLLPPIFIGTLTFDTYFEQYQNSLLLLSAWLIIEGLTEAIFIRWWNNRKSNARYLTIMLITTLALMVMGTSSDLLSSAETKWFALSMLSLLPLLAVRTAKERLPFKLLTSLATFSLLGTFRFTASLETFTQSSVLLMIAYSLAVAGVVAQIPLLRATEDKSFVYKDQKAFLRFSSLLWGMLPATCMIAIGNGLLHPIFLSVLVSLALITRMLHLLKSIEDDGGNLPNSYLRLGTATCWLQVVLLVGSGILSSMIGQDILASE